MEGRLDQFYYSKFPQGPTLNLKLENGSSAPSNGSSDNSHALHACEYRVEFEIDLIQFSGDGLLLAFCGGLSDIHICRLNWFCVGFGPSTRTQVRIERFIHLPATTLKVAGFAWGPARKSQMYEMVSWDGDSVTLWGIYRSGHQTQIYDYPVEDVVDAAISYDWDDKVVVWTSRELFILVSSRGHTSVLIIMINALPSHFRTIIQMIFPLSSLSEWI